MNKIFGKKALLDELNSTCNIKKVEITSEHHDIIEMLKNKNIIFQIKDLEYFNRLFGNQFRHQGIVGYINDQNNQIGLDEFLLTKTTQSIVVIVDSIQDPHNFGAIIRTCAAFNVDAIIYKKDNQVQINEFVNKTSLGGINKLFMIRVVNLSNAIDQLKKYGFWIYASSLNTKNDYRKTKYDKKTCLIVGNEDKGISNNILKKADFEVYIPMSKNIQSLNVSVATGILLAQISEK